MSKTMQEILDGDSDLKKIVTESDTLASHKIQINFGPGRSGIRDFKAIITLWESGKFFHGGGDGHMYMCLDHRLFEKDNTTAPSALPIIRAMAKERTEWGCGSPITAADIRGPAAMCPGCKQLIPADFLTGQIPFSGSARDLAELVTIIFHRLQDNADIYCKYDRSDIRYQTQVQQKGSEEAHRLRALFIYPLFRIIQDTSAGASIEDRFKAFFLA